ncbi:nucleotide sugar dehydrogenase [Thalassiella azotivora]
MALTAAVVGLGYVGLPLAQAATASGVTVLGLDTDRRVVGSLNAGRSHVDDLSDDDVARMVVGGFRATDDASVLGEADVVVICVPTPLSPDGGPDLSAVEAAARVTAEHVTPGTLVVLESTTYPGTTEDLLLPMFTARGFTIGEDLFLAFSPERVDPGNPTYGMTNTPKVVGGVTDACTRRASSFYGGFVDEVVVARGTREAETAKLLENTYRHINIALVNEMSKFCHELGIDLWNVIECASSKPFGFQAFRPGPGVGGHCIPIDPNYLSHRVKAKLGYPFRFVELAQEINRSMPAYVVRRIQDVLNDDAKPLRGSRVLLLGVTYKPDIADQRESPASPLAEQLLAAGAQVDFHDPFVPEWRVGDRVLSRVGDLDEALDASDVAVLLQAHTDYDVRDLESRAARLFDTRGVTTSDDVHRL